METEEDVFYIVTREILPDGQLSDPIYFIVDKPIKEVVPLARLVEEFTNEQTTDSSG